MSAQQQNILCANSNFTFTEMEVDLEVTLCDSILSNGKTREKLLENQEIIIATKMNPFQRHCTVCG